MLPIVIQEQWGLMKSIQLLPTRLSTVYISLQIKFRAKVNNGVRFNKYIWGRRWPGQSILPPEAWIKTAAWCWRKVLKISAEQCYIRTTFCCNSEDNIRHPMDQTVSKKGGAVINIIHYFWDYMMSWSFVIMMSSKGRNNKMIYTNCVPSQSNPKQMNQEISLLSNRKGIFWYTLLSTLNAWQTKEENPHQHT